MPISISSPTTSPDYTDRWFGPRMAPRRRCWRSEAGGGIVTALVPLRGASSLDLGRRCRGPFFLNRREMDHLTQATWRFRPDVAWIGNNATTSPRRLPPGPGRGDDHEALHASRFDDQPPGHAVHRRQQYFLRHAGGRYLHRRAHEGALHQGQAEPHDPGARGRRFPPLREFGHSQISRRQGGFTGLSQGSEAAGAGQRGHGLVQLQPLPRLWLWPDLSAAFPAP